MLFNSYEFLLVFLPITALVFFALGRFGRDISVLWLVVTSLFFYGWWNPVYLLLLVFSILTNYGIGRVLIANAGKGDKLTSAWFVCGILFNLGLIAYFKYAVFAVDTVNQVANTGFVIDPIILPLAISFYTFQQIAYLVDAKRGICEDYSFLHYSFFVSFFPQLIAGPIVHHKDVIPQLSIPATAASRVEDVAVGATIFAIGLFKKSVLADGIAPYASSVFRMADNGEPLSFFVAWGGALAYTCQLYFDFSGYSDMAIGAARIFGIRLPLNFHSPYQATNIIEFWRRWHMTLSQFLRDYLYIPMGGGRGSTRSKYRNLLLTMLLGGLWHGAGWTFVIWGLMHGCYLVINHLWRGVLSRMGGAAGWFSSERTGYRILCWLLTFAAVVVGWVVFRASDMRSAYAVLHAMAGQNGVALPNAILARLGPETADLLQGWGVSSFIGGGTQFMFTWLWVACLLPMALLLPNTQQLMRMFEPGLTAHRSASADELPGFRGREGLVWRPTRAWAAVVGFIAAISLLSLTRVSEFLYFQF